MKLRTVKSGDLQNVTAALASLNTARNALRYAGAKRAAAYVARAIKSAEGAQNHAQRAYASQQQIQTN